MLDWLILLVTLVALYRWVTTKPKNFPPEIQNAGYACYGIRWQSWYLAYDCSYLNKFPCNRGPVATQHRYYLYGITYRGPPVLPIVGSLPFIQTKNIHLWLEKARDQYGPIIGFRFGPSLESIAVCGPEEVMEVLKREEFAARPPTIAANRRGPSAGVMFANGEHWREQRRFTIRHLRDFGFGTRMVSDLVADEVEEFCEKKLKGNSVIQASSLFNTSSINILWAMMAGSRNSYDDESFQQLLSLLNRLFRNGNITGGFINNIRPLKMFLSLFYEFEDDYVDKHLKAYFKKAIDEHIATRSDNPRDLIDVYLAELENDEKKDSFTLDTLMETMRDLFSAGTESASNTVTFALMYLILYPDWQDKLIVEIDENLGGVSPRIEDKLRLPGVDAFLTEVMRSNTIGPMNIPRSTIKDTTLNGYTIRQGTFVNISLWSILQDKKHWGDPENFRPERHLNSDGKCVKDPYMLLFGAGSRICLGENLARNFVFLFFVSLLQRYRFSIPKGDPKPNTLCDPGFTTAPKPFRVALEAR